jgi:hypothetical protein
MVDALGVRNATIDEARKFIESIDTIVRSVPAFVAGYAAGQSLAGGKKIKYRRLKLTTFGDTLILSWEVKPSELPQYLLHVGVSLAFLVALGLERRLLFRGAISVGEYIQSGSIVLGPAVADVATWYDRAEWIGVSATPYCCQYLSALEIEHGVFRQSFVRYDVPVKQEQPRELWSVPWPHHLAFSADEILKPPSLSHYYAFVKKLSIPKGTEDKFFNTETFVKSVLKEASESKPV